VAAEHEYIWLEKTKIAAEHKARGDLSGACRLMESIVDEARELFGEDSPFTLVAKRNLAVSLHEQGDLKRSRALLEDVLTTCIRTLGRENEVTLAAMGSLGGLLRDQGDLLGARRLLEDVLAANRKLRGEDDNRTLTAMDELGETLLLEGDLAPARELREQVLECRRRTLGAEHEETLKAALNLAATAYAQKDFARARELDEQTLPIYRRLLGEEHPYTLRAMDNLAAVLHSQKDLAPARKLQEYVLAGFRRLLGDSHRDTLLAMNNLAVTMADQGDLLGARILLERAIDRSRQSIGPEHFDTLRARQNLTSILQSQGIGAAAGRRCVHCLELLKDETADHLVPRSWYPDDTPDSVQRWTVPSCSQCNKRLGEAEKAFMVTIALCDLGDNTEASDVRSRALRAIGIDATGLSERETRHRERYKRKILSRVVPYAAVKGRIPLLPGTKEFTQPPDDMEPVMLLTMEIVAPVAEKIARGLEFKLTGRYIQPPLSIKTFIVPADKVHELDDVFDGSAELQFGPGCKILRAIPHDNEVIAMYRIVIWKTLLIDVAIGRFAEKGSC
jgi:tetratricopeptide (TPR) repeat protein